MTIDMTREIENYLHFLDFMIMRLSKEIVTNPTPVKMTLLTIAECEKRRVLKVMYERNDMTANEYNKCIDDVYQEIENKYQQRETPSP